jgi:hypothetical protein
MGRFYRMKDGWKCSLHGPASLDPRRDGYLTCGCRLVHGAAFTSGLMATIPPVNRRNLPTASRRDAK